MRRLDITTSAFSASRSCSTSRSQALRDSVRSCESAPRAFSTPAGAAAGQDDAAARAVCRALGRRKRLGEARFATPKRPGVRPRCCTREGGERAGPERGGELILAAQPALHVLEDQQRLGQNLFLPRARRGVRQFMLARSEQSAAAVRRRRAQSESFWKVIKILNNEGKINI